MKRCTGSYKAVGLHLGWAGLGIICGSFLAYPALSFDGRDNIRGEVPAGPNDFVAPDAGTMDPIDERKDAGPDASRDDVQAAPAPEVGQHPETSSAPQIWPEIPQVGAPDDVSGLADPSSNGGWAVPGPMPPPPVVTTPSLPSTSPPPAASFAPAPRATEPTAEAQASLPQATGSSSYLGLALDLGVSGILPDAGLLLTGRPLRWINLQMGVGYNGISPAVRGGLTVINPYLVPLSLTVEGGHYYEGDANRIVRLWNSKTQDIASLRRFSYDYVNLLGGLETGGEHFSFYIRGGLTWMRTTVRDLQQSVRDVAHIEILAADPHISYRGPTLKFGMIYFY
jgi:hypothetical protein